MEMTSITKMPAIADGYIARNIDGRLFFFLIEPEYEAGCWHTSDNSEYMIELPKETFPEVTANDKAPTAATMTINFSIACAAIDNRDTSSQPAGQGEQAPLLIDPAEPYGQK